MQWHWRQFCTTEKTGTYNPKELTAGMVQRFVNDYSGGSFEACGLASEAMAQAVDDLKANDPAGTWLFAEYCSTEAFSITDPRRIPAVVVQKFLTEHPPGTNSSIKMATYDVVRDLYDLQRAGSGWDDFCKQHCFGIRNPRKFPADVAKRVLAEFKPKPKERTQVEDRQASQPHRALSELMRTDLTVFWQWRHFCSQEGATTFNPDEISGDRVQQFLTRHAAGSIETPELSSESLAKQLILLKNSDAVAMWRFGEYSSTEAYGIRNPHLIPASVVQTFLTDYSAGKFESLEMAGDDLVASLLELKRTGSGWHAFCEENSFGIRDPERLPKSIAERFLIEFNPVPATLPKAPKERV